MANGLRSLDRRDAKKSLFDYLKQIHNQGLRLDDVSLEEDHFRDVASDIFVPLEERQQARRSLEVEDAFNRGYLHFEGPKNTIRVFVKGRRLNDIPPHGGEL